MSWIRDLSPRVELCVVIGGAFGLMVVGNVELLLQMLFGDGLPAPSANFEAASLVGLVLYEAVLIVALGAFLRARGWTLAALGIVPRTSDVGWAVALALVASLAAVALTTLVLRTTVDFKVDAAAAPALGTIVLVSIVNAVFEEVFACGYLVARLAPTRGLAFAANASLALKLTYHLYQGEYAVVSVLPVIAVFTLWFVRTRRLVPVMLAHALIDVYGLWAISS